jgi:hypothetical protein
MSHSQWFKKEPDVMPLQNSDTPTWQELLAAQDLKQIEAEIWQESNTDVWSEKEMNEIASLPTNEEGECHQ